MSTHGEAHEEPKPSTTTHEEDRTTAGQRRVNMIWELTQAVIAVCVTTAATAVAAYRATHAEPIAPDGAALQLLSNAFFLIVGFYFSRTNHTKVGGVGPTEGKQR